MDHIFFIKNREILLIMKNTDLLLYSNLCLNSTKFQRKWASHSGTEARGTWQTMIFTYFVSSLPLKFSNTLPLIHLEVRSLFIGVTFFLLNICALRISIQKEKTMSFSSYWWTWQEENIENEVDVQKQPLEVFHSYIFLLFSLEILQYL